MRRYYVHFHVDETQLIQCVDADYISAMCKESYDRHGVGYDPVLNQQLYLARFRYVDKGVKL